MEYYILHVKLIIKINDKDVPFTYINTFFELNEAIKERKLLSMNDNIRSIILEKRILNEDGSIEPVW